mmetsp:Transcript_81899/g.228226  ORF Transcript_81899/g.228226 Transcript_81899/m.228226 type:complete len:259 (-) Transcript_81899:812-1588(-)
MSGGQGRISHHVWAYQSLLHLIQALRRRPSIRAAGETVDHACVRDEVGREATLPHSVQPSRCSRGVSASRGSIYHGRVGDLVGGDARGRHHFQPVHGVALVADFGPSMDDRVIRALVRSQLCVKQIAQPQCRTFCITSIGATTDERVVRDDVGPEPGSGELVERGCHGCDITVLCCAPEHDVEGQAVWGQPRGNHAIQPMLGAGRIAQARIAFDDGGESDPIGCHGNAGHPSKPKDRTDSIVGLCTTVDRCCQRPSVR